MIDVRYWHKADMFNALTNVRFLGQSGQVTACEAMPLQWASLRDSCKTKALDLFNKGEGGFKDRDLYVYCANASDSIITATLYWNRGKHLREIRGKHRCAVRRNDYAECDRGNDKRDQLLVAAPWFRKGCREEGLLHEGQ
jgi:hypothetical protein